MDKRTIAIDPGTTTRVSYLLWLAAKRGRSDCLSINPTLPISKRPEADWKYENCIPFDNDFILVFDECLLHVPVVSLRK